MARVERVRAENCRWLTGTVMLAASGAGTPLSHEEIGRQDTNLFSNAFETFTQKTENHTHHVSKNQPPEQSTHQQWMHRDRGR